MTRAQTVMAQLAAARKARGLTQKEVAQRMNITREAVGRLERCDQEPTLYSLARYAKAIGVRLQVSLAPQDKCGSPAGYRRHARRREPACRPCLDAEAARKRESRRRAA